MSASTMKAVKSSKDLDEICNVDRKVTDTKSVEATYDTWADTYEDDSNEILGFTSPSECANSVAKFAKDGDAFFDCGCGTGLVSQHLQNTNNIKFGTSHGADLSMKMLEHAKSRGLYDTITKLNMAELPWAGIPSDTYDVCACNGVLIYVEEVNCLDEFVRVTKKGGHICLMFRHDGYPTYQAKVESLINSGAWELVDKSESKQNFAATDSAEGSQVMYNIWSFRKC